MVSWDFLFGTAEGIGITHALGLHDFAGAVADLHGADLGPALGVAVVRRLDFGIAIMQRATGIWSRVPSRLECLEVFEYCLG
ncbi:MAG: hypothetical protein JXR25_05100 [Pontiellaceae bacterium]|nr:hypothetical protein [Pontiellaceae bacterium]MBN2784185.1 hypothetical protein [Pontiellaceae bacterium]